MRKIILLTLLIMLVFSSNGQNVPTTFQNPILSGFNPDPSICRVGDDYYLVTSSFVWFPGIPIYHSRDLKNWELLTHVLTDDEKVDLKKLPSAMKTYRLLQAWCFITSSPLLLPYFSF